VYTTDHEMVPEGGWHVSFKEWDCCLEGANGLLLPGATDYSISVNRPKVFGVSCGVQ
jgi:hypothetical protein